MVVLISYIVTVRPWQCKTQNDAGLLFAQYSQQTTTYNPVGFVFANKTIKLQLQFFSNVLYFSGITIQNYKF